MADEWKRLPPATFADKRRVLEELYPGKVKVTSDFRSEEYNRDLQRRGYNAANNSRHIYGEALDILPIEGVPIEEVAESLRQRGFNVTEALHHDGHYHLASDKYDPNQGWVRLPAEGEKAEPIAVEQRAPVAAPTPAAPQIVSEDQSAGFFTRLGRNFQEASQHGFPGWFARKYHDWMDTGKETLRQQRPDLSPEELETLHEQLINKTQADLREQFAKESARDPSWRPDESWLDNLASGRWAGMLLGQIGGSVGPESLILPGSGPIGRIGGQIALGAGSDVVYQGLDIGDGVKKEYDWKETAAAGLFGGGFQTLGEFGAAGARYLQRTLGKGDEAAAPPRADADVTSEGGVVEDVQFGMVDDVAPEAPASTDTVRVYHGGVDSPDSGGGRWVSTNETYAKNYRDGGTLYYTDLPANDPRVNNPDYPDQGVKQGHTFNFELTPEEAARLRPASELGTPAPAPAQAAPEAPAQTPTFRDEHLSTPEVRDNFMEPQASESGRLVYEATADTAKNVQYYTQFRTSLDEVPIQSNLLINKETGEATINVQPDKIGDPTAANSKGTASIRQGLEEIILAFPEIKSIEGVRKTGSRGGRDEVQKIPAKLVDKIRERARALLKDESGSLTLDGSGNGAYRNAPDNLMGYSKDGSRQKGFGQNNYPFELNVRVRMPDGDVFEDTIEGLNKSHALERARRNWDGAEIEPVGQPRRKSTFERMLQDESGSLTPDGSGPGGRGQDPDASKGPLPKVADPNWKAGPDPESTDTGDNWQDMLASLRNKTVEDTPPPTRAGNINLTRITRSADIDAMVEETAKNTPVSERQSREALEDLAHGQNMTVAELLKKNPKLQELPAYAVQMRNLMSQSLQNLSELARKVRSGDATANDRAELAKAWATHGAIQERVSLLGKTAGRLLDSFNINAKGGANYAKALKDIDNEVFTNPEHANRLAELISDANDPAVVNKIVKNAMNPKAEDYLFSLWYNMMLSGPKTHIANMIGNSANFLVDLASNVGAASIGQLRRFGDSKGDRVMFREVLARTMGSMVGAYQGVRAMPTAFRQGMPLDQIGRIEHPQVIQNKVLSAPVRALAAEDEFFRNVAVTSHLYGLATRKALAEGKSADRINELMQDPTPEMLKDATEYGLRMRFQDPPGVLAQKIEQARTRLPGDSPGERAARAALRLIIPFARTPSSLFRTAVRYSPFGIGESVNVKDFKAGGARRDQAIARVAMGSGAVGMLTMWALDGEITGNGPRDPAKRKELEASGWQPNSIKIGDKYHSYMGLEPFSYLLGAVANMTEAEDRLDDKGLGDAIAGLTFAMADVLTSSTWTEGLNQFFEAKASKSDAAPSNYLAGLLSSMTVPAILRQVATTMDEKVRVTTGDGTFEDRLEGRIKSGIPGMSTQLPQAMDVYGRPVEREGFTGPDLLSRMSEKAEDKDPAVIELQRLSKARNEKAALIGPPQNSIEVDGFRRRLTAEEFRDYQYLSGQYILQSVKEEMAGPEWAKLSDTDKIATVEEIKRDMRKAAREQLFSPEAAQWKRLP